MDTSRLERLRTLAESERSEIVLAAHRTMAVGAPRDVIVKKLRDHEARVPSALADEHLVGLTVGGHYTVKHIEATSFEGVPAIVMPFVRGIDLRALMAHARRYRVTLGAPLIDFVVRRVAMGITEVHRAFAALGAPLGGAHGAIRPSNVLLSTYGEVKVNDYASVRLVSSPAELSEPVAMPARGAKVRTTTPLGSLDARGLVALAIELAAVDAAIPESLHDTFVRDALGMCTRTLGRFEKAVSGALAGLVIDVLSDESTRPRVDRFVSGLDAEKWDVRGDLAARLGELVTVASSARADEPVELTPTSPAFFPDLIEEEASRGAARVVAMRAAPSTRAQTPLVTYEGGTHYDESDEMVEVEPKRVVDASEGFAAMVDTMRARASGLWVWSDGELTGEVYLRDGAPVSVRLELETDTSRPALFATEPSCRDKWLSIASQRAGAFAFYDTIHEVIEHGALVDNPLKLVEEAVRHRTRLGIEPAVASIELSLGLRVVDRELPSMLREYGSLAYERILAAIDLDARYESSEGERSSGVVFSASTELVVLWLFGVIEARPRPMRFAARV